MLLPVMKHLFFSILLFLSASYAVAADHNKAVLMVHFGTTFPETRALTIDAINQKVREAFPDADVAEAYTSRIIIRRLHDRGIDKDTPQRALLRLAAAGYDSVVVQSTNIIDGVEASALRDEVEYMAPFFKDIRIGRPLLYSIADCEKVVDILTHRYPSMPDKSYIFVGHGTSTPANAIYSQVDYMMDVAGRPDCTVCTVEGYPDLDLSMRYLAQLKATNVTLVPFMFVAGDHARNDIAGDMRQKLVEAGYNADAVLTGLGQIPEIQDIFIGHIRQAMLEKPLSPSQIKRKALAQ